MKTLYKRDSKGKIRQWSIKVVEQEWPTVDIYGIETSDGIVGGKIKDPIFKEAVPNNQFKTSEAKANAMMKSAIDKKLRSNYFESIDDIKDEDMLFLPTGCPSGMIWEEWKDKAHVIYPALASAKLDGSKMYSTWREDRVFLNTRSAKEHMNFRHIEEALKYFYAENPNLNHEIQKFIDSVNVLYVTICMDVFASTFAPGVSATAYNGLIPDVFFGRILLRNEMGMPASSPNCTKASAKFNCSTPKSTRISSGDCALLQLDIKHRLKMRKKYFIPIY